MNKNIISGMVVLVFSITYTILAFLLPSPASGSVVIGPSVFPGAIGILLIVLAIILIISGLIEARQTKANLDKEEGMQGAQEEGEPQDNKKVLILSLVFFGYMILFVPLGYLISTVLFILSITMYLDRKHWIRNVIYSFAFPIIVYIVFDRLLAVYLPLGPLG